MQPSLLFSVVLSLPSANFGSYSTANSVAAALVLRFVHFLSATRAVLRAVVLLPIERDGHFVSTIPTRFCAAHVEGFGSRTASSPFAVFLITILLQLSCNFVKRVLGLLSVH